MVLTAGFLAGGSRQEKASVRLPCSGKKLAVNASGIGGFLWRTRTIFETQYFKN
jgi:hypothetical protein